MSDLCRLRWKPNQVHDCECAGIQHSNPRLH
jgi:hypothetical protein